MSVAAPAERFRWLLDATAMAIVGVDDTGHIIMTNRQADRLFGYPPDALVGHPIEVLVPEAVERAHIAYRNQYLLDPRTRPMGHGLKLSARRQDGTEFPAEISLAALETDDGILVAATVHDITERVAAERDRERMQAELDRSRRLESIGQLAAGIAHDFNNTLGIMFGQVEVLLDDMDELPSLDTPDARAELRAGLSRIQEAGKRAAQLTQGLLAFGQRQVLHAEPVELDQIATEAARMLSHSLGGRVTLTTELNTTGRRVLADRGKLEQVLFNLVINARDAMPQGGRITVSTESVPLTDEDAHTVGLPPGPYLSLRVRDTGTGIPVEIAERVFEPFFTTKSEGQGTGLGLATVHGTVQQAGGTVLLDSRVGEGTVFTILLPALKPRPAPPPPTPNAPEDLSARRAAYRILVLDDEVELRDLAAQLLRRSGYQALIATSGEDAVEQARTTDVDVLLTDVSMPGMSGPQTADAVRAVRPSVQVVYMSGYARALATGEDVVFIEKPITKASLLKLIDGVVGIRPA
ncbi:hybrid sensor histidine kinase/response regulator [Cryptosporangium japonicum]|uniref:histidine kinase n=1 Tax=Cryptosporangium japonicum TaxID=80872 RepID=A0ABN0UDD8_9ACTN